MRAALVITTYNNPRFLGLVLQSLTHQTSQDFDLFIADDGSSSSTREKIESFRSRFEAQGIQLHHEWHPDNGYQKAKINNVVFKKLGNYSIVICMDHDVVAHYRFVEDHLRIHSQNTDHKILFMGRRVELGEQVTRSLTEENVLSFNKGITLRLFLSALQSDTQNVGRAFRIAHPLIQKLLHRDRVKDLLGSNFSLSRELLWEVNGYDEDYRSYWGEDGDLFIRIRNSGARLIGLKGYAIQYHLNHPRLEPNAEAQARYDQMLGNLSYRRCTNGIFKSV